MLFSVRIMNSMNQNNGLVEYLSKAFTDIHSPVSMSISLGKTNRKKLKGPIPPS